MISVKEHKFISTAGWEAEYLIGVFKLKKFCIPSPSAIRITIIQRKATACSNFLVH